MTTKPKTPTSTPAIAIPRTKSKDIVQRSMPSLTRPRLSEGSEQKLAEVEHKSAACYASSEEASASLRQLAGVPELLDVEDTSTVTHIEAMRQRLASGEQPPLEKP